MHEGIVYRAVKLGQGAFFPSLDDIAYFVRNNTMAGLSTKPNLNQSTLRFFEKIGVTDILNIDVGGLTNLQAIRDGKDHVSISPSSEYLQRRGLTMTEVLNEWNQQGNSHELSRELNSAVRCSG